MLRLIKLWSVTYKTEMSGVAKCKFYTFENTNDGFKIYKILNELIGVEQNVSKDEGNEYYLELLNNFPDAKVNKIM